MRLTFRSVLTTKKTQIWDILNGDVKLGEVRWYAPWRRYCLYSSQHTIFDRSCLTEVCEFLEEQMAKKKPCRCGNPTAWLEDFHKELQGDFKQMICRKCNGWIESEAA